MTFKTFIESIVSLMGSVVVPIIFTLAGAFFLWGIFQYFILGAADEDKRATGRQFAIWGVLGLAVLFSVWGLVGILLSTFGIAPTS